MIPTQITEKVVFQLKTPVQMNVFCEILMEKNLPVVTVKKTLYLMLNREQEHFSELSDNQKSETRLTITFF